MNALSKRIFCLFTSVFLVNAVFAENTLVKQKVNSKFYDELIKDGFVIRAKDDGSKGLSLLPETEKQNQILNNLVEKKPKDYPYTYEALYVLSKQDLLKKSNSSASTIEINDVSRICRSISKMQGMTYYSTTRKKELVLYEKAYTIANAQSKDPIPDKNTGNADGQVLYCLQDDNSFGVTRYELRYYQNETELLASFTNLDDMGIGPVKAIFTGDMKINLLVIDCGEDLLLYICADLDSVKFPGIKGQITDSITSRMDAIYKWFIKQF